VAYPNAARSRLRSWNSIR